MNSKNTAVLNLSSPQLSKTRSLWSPPILNTSMYVKLDSRSKPITTLSEETFSICLGDDVVEFIKISYVLFG